MKCNINARTYSEPSKQALTAEDVTAAVERMKCASHAPPYRLTVDVAHEKVCVDTLRGVPCVISVIDTFFSDGGFSPVLRYWYDGKQISEEDAHRIMFGGE